MPCALAAQSRDGFTEGGLKAREWMVDVVVPRRKVYALLTSGRRNTRMTVPFCEADASRLPSWFHVITVCTHTQRVMPSAAPDLLHAGQVMKVPIHMWGMYQGNQSDNF